MIKNLGKKKKKIVKKQESEEKEKQDPTMQKWPVIQKMMTKRKKSKCIVLNVLNRLNIFLLKYSKIILFFSNYSGQSFM